MKIVQILSLVDKPLEVRADLRTRNADGSLLYAVIQADTPLPGILHSVKIVMGGKCCCNKVPAKDRVPWLEWRYTIDPQALIKDRSYSCGYAGYRMDGGAEDLYLEIDA